MKQKRKTGFSLIELVIVIAILAVLAALLTPALIHYVEDSRAASDTHSMDEVVNAVQISMANPEVYDEVAAAAEAGNVSCYIDGNTESGRDKNIIMQGAQNTAYYTFDDSNRILDEIPYSAAGNMHGVTITFIPDKTSDSLTYHLQDAVVNMHIGGTTKLSDYPSLYGRVKQTVGETIKLSSNTYGNSEYTIFIRIGNTGSRFEVANEPIEVYGQYNGTNLPVTYTPAGTVPDRETTYVPITPSDSNGNGGGNGGGYVPSTPPTPADPQPTPGTEPTEPDIELKPVEMDGYNHYDPELHPKNLIPQGGTYTTAGGEVFVGGDPFPDVAVTGDTYEYGDYLYGYNLIVFLFGNWMRDTTLNGWGVRYLKDEANPPPILETINDDPVVALTCTFLQKKNVVNAPELPLHIKEYNTTFINCSSLASVPSRVPSTVTNIANCFQGCTSLNQAIEVPCSLLSNDLGSNNNLNVTYYHVAGCDHDVTSNEFREITFSIDGETFKTREDMSWVQWIDSEYNTNQKYIAVWYNTNGGSINNGEFVITPSSNSGISVARKEGDAYIFVCTFNNGTYSPVGYNDEIAENAQLYGKELK